MPPHTTRTAPRQASLAPLVLALGLALGGTAALAQTAAGEVEFSRGVGFAQTPGQTPRTLGRGLPLREGDRITTSEGASAIIKLADGTRMTVRPNSELVLQQYQFKDAESSDNSMVMQLLRGGLRAVTGLISKGSPNAARIQTNTATIGIRGTDFDARICTTDCGNEAARTGERARQNAVLASAKLINAQGEITATDAAGQRRRVVDGGSVFPGDMIETTGGARGVLAFRDDSRITLAPGTRFRVDNFIYDDRNPSEGRFLVSLLRGSVRALTGLIAKSNNRNVSFSTSTATIGIRGTGFDVVCGDPNCNGAQFFTWLGQITVGATGQTGAQLLSAGQGIAFTPQGFAPLPAPPVINVPRPDQVTVPPKLFASNNTAETEPGLYVFVRDGHIEVSTSREVLHLGKGEAGMATNDGQTNRPAEVPRFIDFDKLPLPTAKNPALATVLAESGVRSTKICK